MRRFVGAPAVPPPGRIAMRFSGKSILVTGGSSGIGLATAKAFLHEGAEVAIAGRNAAKGRKALASLGGAADRVRFFRADVSRAADVESVVRSTVSAFGGVDVLFNNAGVYLQKPLERTTEREWDEVLAINLKGYFLAAKAVIPVMRRRGCGVIVNNASISSHVATIGESAYAASKGGVLLLTKVLALELAKDGIRVNSVSPGVIRTEMYDAWLADQRAPRSAERREVSRHPIGRLGTPEDVARAVLYLASEEAGFVTGADLAVDGGYLSS
jgi:NAD(P)-dependent dehydrogenase (short-subunit alcohol dehydrogenase family)